VTDSPLLRAPSRLERWAAAVVIVVGVVAFGYAVEKRSAFLARRMGDLDCYLRAAWAVRVAPDRLYDVCDDNGWHYNYPPLFALLLAPLADPPPGEDAAGMLAYPVSIAAFYLLSLAALAAGVHWLATALERVSPDPAVRAMPIGCRRWWLFRIVPVLLCLPPIGHTLMRGQANLFLLATICGAAAALTRGRRLLAGGCLAGAICLKIFPAYLLLLPLWRRDGRCLVGCLLGLVLGLAVVPAAALGPARALGEYQKLGVVLLGPALNLGGDDSRANELLHTTSTDSQSFVVILHNLMHIDQHRWERPPEAVPAVRYAHYVLSGFLTAATLVAARRRRGAGRPDDAVLFLGALSLAMLFISPVCHTHYFALSLPLVMALLGRAWEERGRIPWGLTIVLTLQPVVNALILLPAGEKLKDGGLALAAAMALWGTACVLLWRGGAGAARPGDLPLAHAA
jgi:hypothetical protein